VDLVATRRHREQTGDLCVGRRPPSPPVILKERSD
jgi:hypothetical protein